MRILLGKTRHGYKYENNAIYAIDQAHDCRKLSKRIGFFKESICYCQYLIIRLFMSLNIEVIYT